MEKRFFYKNSILLIGCLFRLNQNFCIMDYWHLSLLCNANSDLIGSEPWCYNVRNTFVLKFGCCGTIGSIGYWLWTPANYKEGARYDECVTWLQPSTSKKVVNEVSDLFSLRDDFNCIWNYFWLTTMVTHQHFFLCQWVVKSKVLVYYKPFCH